MVKMEDVNNSDLKDTGIASLIDELLILWLCVMMHKK